MLGIARIYLGLAAFCLGLPILALAADSSSIIECEQYFRYGSLEMAISASPGEYKPGDSVKFSGTVKNNNNYSLAEGEIFVKIFRRDAKKGEAENGEFQIGEFSALGGINIEPGKVKNVEFEYKLPQGLSDGEHLAQFFFLAAGRYTQAGMPFNVATPGSASSFFITSLSDQALYFDKDKVKINDKDYFFRAINPSLEKDKPITVKAILKNPADTKAIVNLTKELFYWDPTYAGNKLDSRQEEIEIPAGENKEITYIINKADQSVYYVRFTASSNLGETMIGIRPAVAGIFQPKINYAGLLSFPLIKNQKAVYFACFNNTSQDSQENGEVDVVLKSADGNNILSERKYAGVIPGRVIGIAQEFIPSENQGSVILETTLKNSAGKVVDSVKQTYNCDSFLPGFCVSVPKSAVSPVASQYPAEMSLNSVTASPAASGSVASQVIKTILLVALGALVLAGVGVLLIKVRRKRDNFKF